MQAEKKPLLRKANKEEAETVNRFCLELGLHPKQCYRSLYALEVPGGEYRELYDPPETVLRFARERLRMVLYSTGIYMGIYDPQKMKFKPSLPLAHRLARYCQSEARCCKLSDTGEKRFLYGKPVRGPSIVYMPGSRGPCIVINSMGEALGWGILTVHKSKNRAGTPRVEPVIDMGWYLRRGG